MQTKIQFSHLFGRISTRPHLLADLAELSQLFRSNPSGCQCNHFHFQHPPYFVKTDLEIHLVRELHVGLQGTRYHVEVSPSNRDPTTRCRLEYTARFQGFDRLTYHGSTHSKCFFFSSIRRHTISRFPCPG